MQAHVQHKSNTSTMPATVCQCNYTKQAAGHKCKGKCKAVANTSKAQTRHKCNTSTMNATACRDKSTKWATGHKCKSKCKCNTIVNIEHAGALLGKVHGKTLTSTGDTNQALKALDTQQML